MSSRAYGSTVTATRRTKATLLVGAALLAASAGGAPAYVDTPNPVDAQLQKCQRTLLKETTKATAATAKMYGKCLDAGIKDYHGASSLSAATETVCVSALRKVEDSRELGKSIFEKAEAKIVNACDPGTHVFTVEDLLGLPGSTAEAPLNAKKLEAASATTKDAPATIDGVLDLAKYAGKTAIEQATRQTLGASPNSPKILGDLKAKIDASSPPPDDPTKIADVSELIEKMVKEVDGDGDGEIDSIPTTTSSSTTTTSSTVTTTTAAGPVCGNCLWEAGEGCDPCHPQAGPGCQPDCTCSVFTGPCNYF